MKAIQITGPKQVSMNDMEVPRIQTPTQTLIRVKAVGVCGSDMHLMHGSMQVSEYPRVPGHEISGVVEEVGAGVTRFKPGDRIVVEPITYCGHCHACLRGRPNVCRSLKVNSVHIDGGYQEYMLAEESQLHHIPDTLSFVQGAMVEPYTIGTQANWRAGTRQGDVVLIHGAGAIGLVLTQIAKEKGATVIVSEPRAARLQMAAEFGADELIDPSAVSLEQRVMDLTDGMGPNVIFESAGVPALLPLSIEMAANAGTVVSMGFDTRMSGISFAAITKKELNVVGTRLQSNKFEEVIAAMPSRLELTNKLVTNIIPFSEYERAFDLFNDRDRGLGKIVLVW